MHLSREEGAATLRGTLTDDDVVPLGEQMISLRIVPETGGDPIHLDHAHTCTHTPREISGSVLQLSTNARGEFCLRFDLPPGRFTANADWEGSSLIDRAHHSLTFDLSRQTTQIRFEDVPAVADLDSPFEFTLRLEADQKALPGATLNVVNEKGIILGKWTTDRTGRAHVTVPPHRLGSPGIGEIRASFDGNGTSAPSVDVLSIERRIHVHLNAEMPASGNPEDGIWIPIRISSSEAPLTLSSGTVRAAIGETTVGAAKVVNGQARVLASFGSDETTATIEFTYLSDAPWLVAKEPIALTIPIRKKWPWARALIFVGGAALLGWFASTRKRTSVVEFVPEPKAIEAGVTVLQPSRGAITIWKGSVIDAHDLTPIPDARVSVERTTFEGAYVVAATRSAADGSFQLDLSHASPAPGDEWVVDAPLHAELRRPLPQGSDVRIALVTRRRKILERFSSWTKQMGWGAKGRELTPLEVRERALDHQTRAWAELVSQRAFGGENVDIGREAEVDRAMPRSHSAAHPAAQSAAQSGAENEKTVPRPVPPADKSHR